MLTQGDKSLTPSVRCVELSIESRTMFGSNLSRLNSTYIGIADIGMAVSQHVGAFSKQCSRVCECGRVCAPICVVTVEMV